MNKLLWVIPVILVVFSLFFLQRNIKERTLVFVLIVLLSVFFSVVVSQRPVLGDIAAFKNDTLVYAGFFDCVKHNDLINCNDYIGAPWFECILGFLAKVTVLIGGGHAIFFFFISLLFVFSCIFFYSSLGVFLPLAVVFVILQAQFWEFNANILRHSIAVSIFLFLISCVLHSKMHVMRAFPLSFFGFLAHSSSFFYSLVLFLSTKLNVVFLYLSLIFFSIVGESIFHYLADFSEFFSLINDENILYKMAQYQSEGNVNFSFVSSVGTVNFFVIFSFYYFRCQVDDFRFDFILKLLLLTLICGAVFSGTEISYRVINVYVFFIIYLIVFLIKNNVKYSYLLSTLFLFWSFYGFLINSDIILRFFDWV